MLINISTLKAALLFADKNDNRHRTLCTVLFLPRGSETVIVTTDGFRMCYIREESGEPLAEEPQAIIRSTIEAVIKAAGKSKEVSIADGLIQIVDGISVPYFNQYAEDSFVYRQWMEYADHLQDDMATTTDHVAFSPVFMSDFGKALKLLDCDERTARFRFYGKGDVVKYIMAKAGEQFVESSITAIIMPVTEKQRIEKPEWLLRISPSYVDPNAKAEAKKTNGKDVPPKGKGKTTPAAA